MRFAAILRCALFAALVSALSAAFAQTSEITLTGQPTRYPIYGKPFETQGFGNVRFGMSMAEVKARIAVDYQNASSTEGSDPVEGTTNLTVLLPELAPGPGPATINYIFGASSQKLIAIHVFWQLDGNPDDEARRKLFDVGTQLASGLVGFDWQPLSVARGHVLGPGAVVLFSGRDERGGGVEIRLDGVAFDVERPRDAQGNSQSPEHRPAPPGPARLRVSFAANVAKPDTYRLPEGTFFAGGELHGFRSVRFGMTLEEVEQALKAEFAGSTISAPSTADGTMTLSMEVPSLEPGAGPAMLRFTFAPDTRQLVGIRIEWRVAKPTSEQRSAVGVGALRLINDLRQHGVRDVAAIAEQYALQSDGFALYAGADSNGTLAQLHVGGVSIESGNSRAVEAGGPSWMLLSITSM
jgi:hypothetical protein